MTKKCSTVKSIYSKLSNNELSVITNTSMSSSCFLFKNMLTYTTNYGYSRRVLLMSYRAHINGSLLYKFSKQLSISPKVILPQNMKNVHYRSIGVILGIVEEYNLSSVFYAGHIAHCGKIILLL